jgi:hypothetical protein
VKNASADDAVTRLHLFGMSRDRLRAAMAGALGIGLTDLDALEHLERSGPLTQRELGSRLLLTSGGVTMLVDRLEGLGLVRRRPHPTDRRVTLAEIAPEAELPDLPEIAAYHQNLRTAAQALPPPARAAITEFLQTIAAAADSASQTLRARTPPRSRTTAPTPG